MKKDLRTYRAVDANVKLTGRVYDDGKVTWLVHSGSAAEFFLDASEAEIVLAGDSSVNSEEQYRPRYVVFAGERLVEDSLMSSREQRVKIFLAEDEKKVPVRIIHLSEANYGAVGIKSINVVSESQHPLIPVPAKKYSIEFIGDSITCAYGVESESGDESFTTSTENFMKSYAYLTAQLLDADYSAVSYSGHGVISGYTENGEKDADSIVPDYYTSTAKISEYAKPWDFSKKKHDFVVINLGTNDYTYIKHDFAARTEEFSEKYYDFLCLVREKNPAAYIICTVGIMGCAEIYPAIEEAAEKFASESDRRITSFLFTPQKESDGYGADWHPSAVTQELSSAFLAEKIRSIDGFFV